MNPGSRPILVVEDDTFDAEMIAEALVEVGADAPIERVEDGAEAVGTTTSISFNTWVRGSRLPAQGVAWVGTIRTRRRGGSAGDARRRRAALRQAHEGVRGARV